MPSTDLGRHRVILFVIVIAVMEGQSISTRVDEESAIHYLLGDALLARFLRSRLAQGSGRATTRQFALFLLLLSEGQQLGVFVGIGLSLGDASALLRFDATSALKDDRRDEALDFRSLRLRLLLAFFQLQRPSDDVLSDIVVLGEVEELADLAGSFRSETTGDCGVGQTWNFSFALLHDDEVENGQVGVDDASSDASAVTLSRASGPVARVLGAEKKADAPVGQHSLHHGETLFVVSTTDAEHVALPLVAERISWDFLRHLLVEEDAEFAIIFDLDQLLASGGRVGNV